MVSVADKGQFCSGWVVLALSGSLKIPDPRIEFWTQAECVMIPFYCSEEKIDLGGVKHVADVASVLSQNWEAKSKARRQS